MIDEEQGAGRVARLYIATGFGRAGAEALAGIEAAVQEIGEAHRICIGIWKQEDALDPVVGDLLAARNLDRLRQIGYQVPGPSAGEAPEITILAAVDATDQSVRAGLERAFSQAKSAREAGRRLRLIGFLIGPGNFEACFRFDGVSDAGWDVLVPCPARDPLIGDRTVEDVVSLVTHEVLALTIPEQAISRHVDSADHSAEEPNRVPILRMGAAFLDGRLRSIREALAKRIAGRLLRRQFENPQPYAPAAAFAEDMPLSTREKVGVSALLSALARDVPFLIAGTEGDPIEVRLAKGALETDLVDVRRDRWIAVLKLLEELYDNREVLLWTDKLHAAQSHTSQEVSSALFEDFRTLHKLDRGPDRILVWCDQIADELIQPVEIADPGALDFDAALRRLSIEIGNSPNMVSMWVRVAVLGLLGAIALNLTLGALAGRIAGVGGAALALLAAALFGARETHVVYKRLMRARAEAVQALARKYERWARGELISRLHALRNEFRGWIDRERQANQDLCTAAVESANALDPAATPDPVATPEATPGRTEARGGVGAFGVEWAVRAEEEPAFLEFLSVPYVQLHLEAARQGALVPKRADRCESPEPPVDGILRFVFAYLDLNAGLLRLSNQVVFRLQGNNEYVRECIDSLFARTETGSGSPTETLVAPGDLLPLIDPDLKRKDPEEHVTVREADFEALALLRSVPQARGAL